MSGRPDVEGSWPGRLRITRGWARAEARPWNDTVAGSHLRLLRGGADFLSSAAHAVTEIGGAPVHSPALFASALRPWERAGFRPVERLVVLERPLTGSVLAAGSAELRPRPPWEDIARVDNEAFAGFWRLGRLGLEESWNAARRSMSFTVSEEGRVVGFAIAGSGLGVAYLQRIAVSPAWTRRALGTSLLTAALSWARGQGCRAMILNVKEDAQSAVALYRSHDFADTGTRLHIMRRELA